MIIQPDPPRQLRQFARTLACLLVAALSSCASSGQAGSEDGPMRKVPKEKRLVVLFEDFTNNSVGPSKAAFDGLTRGLPTLIVNDFIQIGSFRPVVAEDRLKAMEELALSRSGLTDGDGLRVGQLAGAQVLLRGEFSESAGLLTVTARTVSVETGEVTGSVHAFGPTEQSVQPPDALIKRISLGLMQRMALRLKPDEVQSLRSNIECTNIHALDSNYRGEKLAEMAELARRRMRGRGPGAAPDPELEEEIREVESLAGAHFEEAIAVDPNYGRSRHNLGTHQKRTGRTNFAASIRPNFKFGKVVSAKAPRWMTRSPASLRARKLKGGFINKKGSYSPSRRRALFARRLGGPKFKTRGRIVNLGAVRKMGGRVRIGGRRLNIGAGRVRVGGGGTGRVHVPKVKAPKVKVPKVKVNAPKVKFKK